MLITGQNDIWRGKTSSFILKNCIAGAHKIKRIKSVCENEVS